jgi:hypothetical protein
MKTMQRVTIGSDTWSRLKTLREGFVYDSLLTFLFELIQNSQRAKATTVWIESYGNSFKIVDNGTGCQDPNALFTMDFSGFGVGYGVGFTSVYPIADTIKVETQGWRAELDMVEAIEKKNLSLDIHENPFVQGFSVTLESEKIGNNQDEIVTKVHEIASVIPNINIYVNGNLVEKIDLFEAPSDTTHHMKANNRIYEARLSIAEMREYGGVDVYYEHRHVCFFHKDGIKGKVLIKNHKITLKAPDRKSIIWDDKRHLFIEQLERDLSELCVGVVKNGTDEEREKYADTIDEYLGVEKYIRYLHIDEHEIKNQYETREKAQKLEESSDGQMELSFEEAGQEEGYEEPAPSFDAERRQEDLSFRSYVSENRKSDYVTKGDLNQVSISNIKRKKNVVWVEKREVERYEDLITRYEYYGVHTFISPHVLYDRALRHLGITHIGDVEDRAIEKQYNVKKIGSKTKKEQRAMELLGFIERKLDLGQTFYISDIECKMIVSLQEAKIYQEKLGVEGYAQGGIIHLNRKSLKFGKLSSSDAGREKIGIHDVKFILANLELIAHELAHRVYHTKDNTISHYEAQNKLQEKIGEHLIETDVLY